MDYYKGEREQYGQGIWKSVLRSAFHPFGAHHNESDSKRDEADARSRYFDKISKYSLSFVCSSG